MKSEEITQQVLERLDAVAAKLGVAAEHLWGVFVQQSIIEGAVTAIAVILAAFVCYTTAFVTSHRRMRGNTKWWSTKGNEESPTFQGVLGVISITLSIILTWVILTSANDWTSKILNPEYFAWQEIQRIVK